MNKKIQTTKKKYQDMKLSEKITVATGLLLVIILLALIIISAVIASSSLIQVTDEYVNALAVQTELEVQNVVDSASSTANDIQEYLTNQYQNFDGIYKGEQEESKVYKGKKLEALNASIEEYLLNTAWSSVNGSEYIIGVGVFFEQDAFDPNIKDYTIYVGTEDAKNHSAISYGAYSEYSSQIYYAEAATTQSPVFTDPYEAAGVVMITAAFPIVYEGTTQGVVMVDVAVSEFAQIDMTSTVFKSLNGNVITNEGIFIYDAEDGIELTGKSIQDYFSSDKEYQFYMQKLQGTEAFRMETTRNGEKIFRYCQPIDAAGDTWWAQSILTKSDMNKKVTILLIIMFGLAIAGCIITLLMIRKFIRKLLKPIDGIVDAAEHMAVGDFSMELKAESQDEIGQLTNAFDKTIRTLNEIIRDLGRGMQEMSAGNFNINPGVEYPGAFKQIEDELAAFIVKISETLAQINEASNQVAAGSEQIAQGAQSLTDGATEQAGAIEELQATVSEVTTQVEKNAQNTSNANLMAKNVGNHINESNSQMQEMVTAMDEITKSSNQIGEIINSITEIAAQTNLLALNASIEAARAGEMGKGFAVVANEVGHLADQSAQAAKDSTALIAESIKAVENGKAIADMTANKLSESAGETQELVANIAQVSEATEKQAESLEQISDAVEQIAAVIEENTAMAEESSASSEEMSAQAEALRALIQQFQLLNQE